jgi:hypothetical protein
MKRNSVRLAAVVTFCLSVALVAVGASPNMNGEYYLSSTITGKPFHASFTDFDSYPNGGTEYFDLYSPKISTLYSQVFWTTLDPVALPRDIVERFDGKGMAVVGFEIDQVFKSEDGKEDISVPINVAYNHHFESHMIGKNAVMEKIVLDGPNDPRAPPFMGHRRPNESEAWVVRELKNSSLPSSQSFGAGNGGEYRKSFHGYAPGYAQVIESPQKFSITPMQIDTFHRTKMNKTGGSKFVSGPVPRNSLAPKTGGDATYSGLLECPVTTRVKKVVTNVGYQTVVGTKCPAGPIATSSECFQAAKEFVPQGTEIQNDAGSFDDNVPVGCSLEYSAEKGNEVIIRFNEKKSAPSCDKLNATSSVGSQASLVHVSLSLDAKKNEAVITLTGPAGVWFGVGWDAQVMADAPWAIIIDGSGKVSERKLATHNQGTLLKPSVKVVSTKLSPDGKSRTIILSRPLQGASSSYYTFDITKTKIGFINAIGSSAALSYHKEKTAAVLSLLPVGSGACVCASATVPFGEAQGSLVYENTSVGFQNKCYLNQAPHNPSDLLAERNPTCDLRTYAGGQTACHHLWYLLDADQEIPWNDTKLEYHLKFRFHVQPYNETIHKPVVRQSWGLASPVEYDVPKCPEGTPTKKCVHKITGSFVVGQGPGEQNLSLVRANFHCHAPTCLGFELYHNETRKLICRETPLYGGNGLFEKKFDEQGYIAIPPCLWGEGTQDLEPPVLVSGQPLYSVKYANSTYGHHGEMAWMQVYMTY